MSEHIVFSSGKGRICATCGWPADDCNCSRCLTAPEEPVPAKIEANLRLENRSASKTVTVIEGLPKNSRFLQDLAREMKKFCGTGGHVSEGSVELQGDQRERLRGLLAKKGWPVKS